ncbi:MAG: response regulator transcription factor [Clostridia bacterium]|nr:response regulator transcription factor [Clostridia bacterium]
MQEIRVLIADDHALIREGITKVLSLEPKIVVVGEASDGEEAVAGARELKPHIILMDLNMPRVSGIEATRLVRQELPQVKIIALTVHDDDQRIFEVIKAGVSGYILKDVDPGSLLKTILAVHAGEIVIHPTVTTRLLGEFHRLTEVAQAAEEREAVAELLTHREMEILKHIAKGKSNREIAESLCISEKTVKNHISNIFRKIQVEDRTQAALFAVKTKLVEL